MSTLQNILENCGYETYPYSGRGMYGEKCLAVNVTNLGKLMSDVIFGVDDANRDELAESTFQMQTDSMGKGIVAYFPGTKYEG